MHEIFNLIHWQIWLHTCRNVTSHTLSLFKRASTTNDVTKHSNCSNVNDQLYDMEK